MRIIAVDWSGAASGADRRIWLAEVSDGRLVRLESGRSRENLTAHLIEEAARDPDLIVGLDFAFSFPAWYLESHGIEEVRHLWRIAAERGEAWLAACETPFWGRPGKGKPGLSAHFRRTEQEAQAVAGTFLKSVFQIGGPAPWGPDRSGGCQRSPSSRGPDSRCGPFILSICKYSSRCAMPFHSSRSSPQTCSPIRACTSCRDNCRVSKERFRRPTAHSISSCIQDSKP